MLDKRPKSATTTMAHEIPAGMQGRILATLKGEDGFQVAFAPEGSPLAFMVEGIQEGIVVGIVTTSMGTKVVLPADIEIDGEVTAFVKNLFTTTQNEIMFAGHGDMPVLTQVYNYTERDGLTPFQLDDLEAISAVAVKDDFVILTRTGLYNLGSMTMVLNFEGRGIEVGNPLSVINGPNGSVVINVHVAGKGYKAYAFDTTVDGWPTTSINDETLETLIADGYLPRPIAAFTEDGYVFENTLEPVAGAQTFEETFLTVEQAIEAGWFEGVVADTQGMNPGTVVPTESISGGTRTFGDPSTDPDADTVRDEGERSC